MNYADSLQIDTNLTYCPHTLTVSKPLTITNVSEHQLAFKVKTNKKNLVSMNPCNGFIKPLNSISIPVKIVQSVPEHVSVKLEVDWCNVTPEMKQKNDIKMSIPKDKDIFKKIFPIVRKQQKPIAIGNQVGINEVKVINQQPVQFKKFEKQEKKITPFEYEKKEIEYKQEQSPKQPQQNEKQSTKQQEQTQINLSQQYTSANNMSTSISSPTRKLQIVSEEDEEDHEKELEQIRSQQINQLRAIDEVRSKIRKINQQVKSTQIIDPKLLIVGLAFSFLVGSFLQHLIF